MLNHLSLWCLHNPELAEHFNECHLGLHNGQSHSNAVSGSTPKWNEGTSINGGLLGLAEPTAEEGERVGCNVVCGKVTSVLYKYCTHAWCCVHVANGC